MSSRTARFIINRTDRIQTGINSKPGLNRITGRIRITVSIGLKTIMVVMMLLIKRKIRIRTRIRMSEIITNLKIREEIMQDIMITDQSPRDQMIPFRRTKSLFLTEISLRERRLMRTTEMNLRVRTEISSLKTSVLRSRDQKTIMKITKTINSYL